MKRVLKIGVTVLLAGSLCLAACYEVTFQYWSRRFHTIPKQPVEKEVMWTGLIKTTNGWEFKLENLWNLRRRAARPVFCPATRQLFLSFGDKDDDGAIYQWDIDTGTCVFQFKPKKGFLEWAERVSPDGNYLLITRYPREGANWETAIVSVKQRKIVAELGDLGAIFRCRFNPDCTKMCLWTGATHGEVAFDMNGKQIKNFRDDDFLKLQNQQIWYVPISKGNLVDYGLYFRDKAGSKHLVTKDCWSWGYNAALMDGRIIIVPTCDDDILVWDAASNKEIARKRVTNHHNGAGFVFYDAVKDRFLIVDPSYQGTTYLRTLSISKHPPNG